MGNSAAYIKAVFQTPENPSLEEEIPGNKSVHCLMDPRSPTVQFDRTPIEVNGSSVKGRNRNQVLPSHMLRPVDQDNDVHPNDPGATPKTEGVVGKMKSLHLLSFDPRSPSIGIVRTPIQVETTPDCRVEKYQKENYSPTDSLVTATSLAPMEDQVFPLDESLNECDMSHVELSDPRSPTMDVVRTPIQVECKDPVPESSEDATEGALEPENSKLVIPNNLGIHRDGQLQNWKHNGRLTSEKWNKENADHLPKRLFGTPDSKEQVPQAVLKVRTPLRTMSANDNSPHHMLRVKQVQGINQELGRIYGIENALPDCDKFHSPVAKKQKSTNRMSSEWDKDGSIII